MPDQPVVHVGELWADEYPGNEGRLLKVERIEQRKRVVWHLHVARYVDEVESVAVCTVVRPPDTYRMDTTGRTVRIAVRRMRPGQRGYRLVAYACKPLDCVGTLSVAGYKGCDPVHCEHGRPFCWGEGWEPVYTSEELGERLGVKA